ncbi:MAG: hypothetical protein ABIH38_04335 [Patescibacteria group bacterium]
MESDKPKLNTIVYLLYFLFFACVIFIGLVEKWFSFPIGGMLLSVFVVLPHLVAFFASVSQGNHKSAVVIGTFLGFWSYLTLGLFFFPYAEIVSGLKVVEIPVFVVVFIMSYFYRADKSLTYILIHLGATVFFLWAAKFVTVFEPARSSIVGILGIGVIFVAINQTIKAAAKPEAAH